MSEELETLDVLDALDELKSHTDWTWKDAENYEIIKASLERKDKLENVIEILKSKDIEMNLLKGTFKFETSLGYSYYLKVWCMSSLLTFDDRKFINEKEYELLKEILK